MFLLSLLASLSGVSARGFSEPQAVLYGSIRQQQGASSFILQSGTISLTLVNEASPSNVVNIEGSLRDIGAYSYSIILPLEYLPAEYKMNSHIAVGAEKRKFLISSILVNGQEATLLDGSQEFLSLSMEDRGAEIRLDLAISAEAGDSDLDGLPDTWENMHGLTVGLEDQNTDADGDEWTALEEYLNGTDPNFDNRQATVTNQVILLPELGNAGVYLHVVDSNSVAEEIELSLNLVDLMGMVEVSLFGVTQDLSALISLSYAEMQSGALTIRQLVSWEEGRTVDVSLTDPDRAEPLITELSFTTAYAVSQEYADAQIWLDAASFTETAGAVSLWADRSGNEQMVMQSNSSYQPQLVEDESGLPSVDFSGASAHLFLPENTFHGSEQTIFLAVDVEEELGKAHDRYVWASQKSAGVLLEKTAVSSHSDAFAFRFSGESVTSWSSKVAALYTLTVAGQTPHVQSGWDASVTSLQSVSDELAFPTLGLKRGFSEAMELSSLSSFSGLIHEFIVVPRTMEEQEKRRVQNFLTSKWEGSELWDFGEELHAITLNYDTSSAERLVRGGWGSDTLGGSPSHDVFSGGAGDDSFTGGAGEDLFLFGLLDLGANILTDFSEDEDRLDFSALFTGVSGDVMDYLSLSYDYTILAGEPVVDTVLSVVRPDGESLSIRFNGLALSTDILRRWVVEGVMNVGSLSVDQSLVLELVGSETLTEGEETMMRISRSGAGTVGAVVIPVALMHDSLDSREFILPGVLQPLGDRALVALEAGELETTFTLQALSDGVPEGHEAWQLTVADAAQWTVDSSPVTLHVSDYGSTYSLGVDESVLSLDGVSSTTLTITRSGDLSEVSTVDLTVRTNLETSAWSQLPELVTFSEGQTTVTVPITLTDSLTRRGVILVSIHPERGAYLSAAKNVKIQVYPSAADQEHGMVVSDALSGEAGEEDRMRYAYGLNQWESIQGVLELNTGSGSPRLRARVNAQAIDVDMVFKCSSDLEVWEDVTHQLVFESAGDGQETYLHDVQASSISKLFYTVEPRVLVVEGNVSEILNASAEAGVTVETVSQEAVDAFSWVADEGVISYRPPSQEDTGSTRLTLKGEGTYSFRAGVSGAGRAEIWQNGLLKQVLEAGSSETITIEVYEGLVETLELKAEGAGVYFSSL